MSGTVQAIVGSVFVVCFCLGVIITRLGKILKELKKINRN